MFPTNNHHHHHQHDHQNHTNHTHHTVHKYPNVSNQSSSTMLYDNCMDENDDNKQSSLSFSSTNASSSPSSSLSSRPGSSRRRSFRIIDDDSTSDDCLVRLIKDACFAHCQKNNVRITDSNILDVLNEVIGDIKMIIMIDERKDAEQNDPDEPELVNEPETTVTDLVDRGEIKNEKEVLMSKPIMDYIERLVFNIKNEALNELFIYYNQQSLMEQGNVVHMEVIPTVKRATQLGAIYKPGYSTKKPYYTSSTAPSSSSYYSPSSSSYFPSRIDIEDEISFNARQNQPPSSQRKCITELFLDGPNIYTYLHYFTDIWENVIGDPLEWYRYESESESPKEINFQLTPPPIDRSQFTDCLVEVRQIGTSVNSKRKSRFLQNRSRFITYAEICEYPLVLCLDFYYISGFVPKKEIRCPSLDRVEPEIESPIANDNCSSEQENDQEDSPNFKRRKQSKLDLQRRRRSKFLWWEQDRNIAPEENYAYENNYNDEDNYSDNEQYYLEMLKNKKPIKTSDYHEEEEQYCDDEEYRENSYDQYVFDDDLDLSFDSKLPIIAGSNQTDNNNYHVSELCLFIL